MIYQIKDWQEHFESAKSKTFQRCTHAYIPNKQDGDGYLFILSQPDGAAIYGCWQMLVMACSLQVADTTSPRQGYCTDTGRADGEPWTAAYLAMRWRRTEQEVQRMLDITSSPPVNWVSKDTASIPQGYSKDTKRSSDKAKAKAKALIKPKHITFPAPTAAPAKGDLKKPALNEGEAPPLESSQEPSRPIHYPKAKTVVGIWIEANKACGRENVKVTNKDLGFVKKLDGLCPDHGELFYCMKAYIDDKDDKYVENHGHPLYLLLDKFSKYSVLYPKYLAKMAANDVEYGLNGANVTGDSDAIPGESHNAGDYHDGIDDLVAEHEAKENNHAS